MRIFQIAAGDAKFALFLMLLTTSGDAGEGEFRHAIRNCNGLNTACDDSWWRDSRCGARP
jgi:hypothetical protein